MSECLVNSYYDTRMCVERRLSAIYCYPIRRFYMSCYLVITGIRTFERALILLVCVRFICPSLVILSMIFRPRSLSNASL
ncbi:hypothetical protein F5Y12DRAFT_762987 [Xylaria sp. FL1777]|nr:hypothetical protein F5Y12DRAFT_762987 [Xylaria sp. FL1777]